MHACVCLCVCMRVCERVGGWVCVCGYVRVRAHDTHGILPLEEDTDTLVGGFGVGHCCHHAQDANWEACMKG